MSELSLIGRQKFFPRLMLRKKKANEADTPQNHVGVEKCVHR
jgi:hypothetical protein